MQSTYDKIQYYRLSRKEKEAVILKLKTLLANKAQVRQAWVFGSFTRQGSIRDVDLAVELQSSLPFKEFLNLNAEIELELHLPVDLVEITKVSSELKSKIITSGILVKGTKRQERQ